jgi:glycosyltransferase involved in cell wall biosynthesis
VAEIEVKKLKVCQIVSADLWAGAEIMSYHLIRQLNNYPEIELLVILLNKGVLADRLQQYNINFIVISEENTSFLNLLIGIKKIVRDFCPHILHSHRYKENILAFLCSRGITEIKLISTQHGYPEQFSGFTNLRYKFLVGLNFFVLSRSFKYVVIVSSELKERILHRFKYKNDKLKVIHNGIEISDRLNKTSSNKIRIGSAGRFVPVKDFLLLVQIAAKVTKKNKNIYFSIIGDGPEKMKILNLINDLDLKSNFQVYSFSENIDKFYQELDIYLNTSVHEGIPLSILEAMSYAIAVIAPDVGGLGEIIENEKEGFLIAHRDASSFAEKCLLLSDNINLRIKIGESGREKVKSNFTNIKMAEKYYNLYHLAVRF